ncbi:SdiA-regulated domain-containing protein [Nitrospira sp. M1]
MRQAILWSYLTGLLLLCGGFGHMVVGPAWAHDQDDVSLTFLGYVELKDLGPEEPSGLAWGRSSKGKPRLWIVSDDTAAVYVLKEKRQDNTLSTFKVTEIHSLSSKTKELEGLTVDSSGRAVIVQEGTNSVIRLEAETFEEAETVPLSAMTGFDCIQPFFEKSGSNKGLEGVTWNATQGTFFVVKEGSPPMLIELRDDLHAILKHWILDQQRGFEVSELSQNKLDVSGIAYDSSRDVLWMVSDKGQHLFVYDYHQHMVTQRIPLGYRAGKEKGIGIYQRIKKAEGVAISLDGHTVYVVSDSEARLYVYAIEPAA